MIDSLVDPIDSLAHLRLVGPSLVLDRDHAVVLFGLSLVLAIRIGVALIVFGKGPLEVFLDLVVHNEVFLFRVAVIVFIFDQHYQVIFRHKTDDLAAHVDDGEAVVRRL